VQPAYKFDDGGFVGAVTGMSLADIIQLKGTNRYSGCLAVNHHEMDGVIFFRDGEVVHAEQGGLTGEDAFYVILGWKGGSFKSEPKILTTSRTINQSLSYLILEGLRIQDEAERVVQLARKAKAASSREGGDMSDINKKLSTITDVEQALIMTKEGQVVDDTSYQAELLGANALFLAIFAGHIGSQFGVGDLKSATVHGSEHHLFLFDSKRHHLCVSAKGSSNINALDSEIRRVLAQK